MPEDAFPPRTPSSRGTDRLATSSRRSILGLSRRSALEIVAVLGVVVAISAWQTRNLVATGGAAPTFALEDLDGNRVTLASLRGKRTLIHFWATWCGVCRQELSTLNAVQDGLSSDEALVTIVADSEDPERVRAFSVEHGLRYPVLLATPEVLRAYRIHALPTNYYVGANGIVRGHTVGMSTRWSFRARLALAR